MSRHHYIACDLGAESGRVMLGTLADGKLSVEEIHRFPNGPTEVFGSLRWDLLRMYDELKGGLKKVSAGGVSVSGLSCDSWGVDYVLFSAGEPMLALPYHYRDSRTDGAFERAFAVVPAEEIFSETGIQFMPINTLYQLHDDLAQRPVILGNAERFLNIGDYFNYLFCSVAKADESLASTTQLYNPQARRWSGTLIRKFGFPERIFPEVVPSGTILGPLRPPLNVEPGLRETKVIAGCSHDTGAAVAAVPAAGNNWAYLSSGTWSLLGVENSSPIINAESRKYNFTNEIGYNGSIRFLRNITGLWILQECRRSWAKGGQDYTYDQLTRMAEQSAPLKTFFDPQDSIFAKPDNMPQKVADNCRKNGQLAPETPAEITRCILESLALSYRKTLEQLRELTRRPVSTLHIVGGGSKNQLLNQFAANATGCPVLAGPVECTAIGNVLVQAITLGHIPSLQSGREIVGRSFPLVRYEPQEQARWEDAYVKFSEFGRGS